ncbi:odorant receptor 30a-like isoform X2 [Cylas formicarius]|uniref:odorant receptor 30a-like isoform X2 n=1 Tax=Cylas formicarius TaxID=197179 RepID=UPI0029585461|nr:odorant receptor 30a-like isoform X2 [Cylas formicarius]
MLVAGIWRVEVDEFSTIKKKIYSIYSVIIQIICTSPIVSATLYVPMLFNINRVADAISNIGIVVFFGMVIAKMMMCQTKPIINLLEVALRTEFRMGLVDAEVEAIYESHINLDNGFITLLFAWAILMGLCVASFGDVNCYMYFKQNSNVTEKPVLVNYWYPFDINKHYAVIMIDQNIRPTVASLCVFVVNSFVNCIIIFVRLQLKLLQHSFRNFDKLCLESGQSEGGNVLMMLCVEHQKLIEYVQDLNESFKTITLLEYMVSSVSFAAQIFQITAGVRPYLATIILCYTILQLFIFAWSSNEVIIQSEELARALFESDWFVQDVRTQALVHIMMLRCQKPLSLKIARFGVMDLDVAISRLKLAYSYASLISGS